MLGAIFIAVFVFVVWIVIEANGKCRRLEAKVSPGLCVRRHHVAAEVFESEVWVFGKFGDDIGVAFEVLALEVNPLLAWRVVSVIGMNLSGCDVGRWKR
jgi:hypothetical protein